MNEVGLDRLAGPHGFQTQAWARIKASQGWEARAFESDGLVFLVLLRPISLFKLAYVPYIQPISQDWCAFSRALARCLGPRVFVIRYDFYFSPDGENKEIGKSCLKVQKNSVQPSMTIVNRLDKGYDQVYLGYRSRVKRSLSRPVFTTREGGMADLEAWYAIYLETARHDGFSARSLSYMKALLENGCRLYLAYQDLEMRAGIIVLEGPKVATFLYGATIREKGTYSASVPVQDMAIRIACEKGLEVYDFQGAGMSGHLCTLTQFKAGFGGVMIERQGTSDYPVHKLFHRLFVFCENIRYKAYRKD
ncbi:MAG: peptidoglycan bridge formation glycyltransferase FemA/FemB family protein [Sphaerochaetaceae bacterium]|jgi:lipid II:glycine glycyltransferase (peptidoglycan interpeptide bridge formation enzyme)|nr:peptidoglycan bridge formation glycyltransferase FemA/FemB family protein [Sphaerochaetaceae bacterium]